MTIVDLRPLGRRFSNCKLLPAIRPCLLPHKARDQTRRFVISMTTKTFRELVVGEVYCSACKLASPRIGRCIDDRDWQLLPAKFMSYEWMRCKTAGPMPCESFVLHQVGFMSLLKLLLYMHARKSKAGVDNLTEIVYYHYYQTTT